jgi:hypothetical protein
MSVYFTDWQWKFFFQVQACKKPLEIEYISWFWKFQNGFFAVCLIPLAIATPCKVAQQLFRLLRGSHLQHQDKTAPSWIQSCFNYAGHFLISTFSDFSCAFLNEECSFFQKGDLPFSSTPDPPQIRPAKAPSCCLPFHSVLQLFQTTRGWEKSTVVRSLACHQSRFQSVCILKSNRVRVVVILSWGHPLVLSEWTDSTAPFWSNSQNHRFYFTHT